MKHFMRPYIQISESLPVREPQCWLCACIRLQVLRQHAIRQLMTSPSAAVHCGSQGYLGVLVGDVDNDSAEAQAQGCARRGDHADRPRRAGGQVGLQGQRRGARRERAEPSKAPSSCGRMLREIPPGRKIKPGDQPRRQHPDPRACSWSTARSWSTTSGTS